MKARLWMIVGLVALLCGCKAHYPVAQESGKEDMAYLLFTSPGEYAGKEVTVMLDGKQPFEAKVVKAKMPIERAHRMRFLPDEEKLM